MIQRFIEIGEGYSDICELLELIRGNKHRVSKLFAFHTTIQDKQVTSLAVAFQPTIPGDFQAVYICREGIPNPTIKPNQRYTLFEEVAKELDLQIITLEVKPSTMFHEKELYYQHLIGILRMNRYIPPMK
ncbi:methylthioribose kinase [Bacillus timonensis]|uniref:Methylthioribose kinase n=1 Tax=Bacillus timonensis TaxID=1033734 RepID=A0A4S3PWX4_9BACI|nr:methylthioribose kinase [Bacillus timonensis]THE14360.1 methylthioribose kinase [Bacillus timonensis]